MIVWGGLVTDSGIGRDTNTGGRYNPSNNTWTSIASLARRAGPGGSTPRLDRHGDDRVGHAWTGRRIECRRPLHPLTNVWSATSLVNAPEGRYRHTVVWSGAEVIVWGGKK